MSKKNWPNLSVEWNHPNLHPWQRPARSKAHLRERGNMIYLCWREGKKVKNLYLGTKPQRRAKRSAKAKK